MLENELDYLKWIIKNKLVKDIKFFVKWEEK